MSISGITIIAAQLRRTRSAMVDITVAFYRCIKRIIFAGVVKVQCCSTIFLICVTQYNERRLDRSCFLCGFTGFATDIQCGGTSCPYAKPDSLSCLNFAAITDIKFTFGIIWRGYKAPKMSNVPTSKENFRRLHSRRRFL